MSPAQLTKWRGKQTAKSVKQDALNASVVGTSNKLSTSLATSTPFYTGKPYIAETGSYAFKYREYNPEMARWTTVDPSGFPDGANNRVYAAAPTSEFDPNGCSVEWITQEDNPKDPNPTLEAQGNVNFSWSIQHNGSALPSGSGSVTTHYNGAVSNPNSVGYYTGGQDLSHSGIAEFSQSFSMNLASRHDGQWHLNGWSVTATFIQNVGGVNYAQSNARLNPIGAFTSSTTITGLSTLLHTTLLNHGARYNGDLFRK